MRCFFACPLPAAAATALTRHFAPLRLRFSGAGCRWVPAENLHFTLRFLGDSDRGRLFRVTEAASSVFSGVAAPQLHLDEPGLFPPRGARDLILWAGLGGQVEAIARLARALEACARESGFAPEARPFRPHVTVARIDPRRAGSLQDLLLPALPGEDCTPAAVHLYQSTLERTGSRYTVLHSWPLRPAPAHEFRDGSFPG